MGRSFYLGYHYYVPPSGLALHARGGRSGECLPKRSLQCGAQGGERFVGDRVEEAEAYTTTAASSKVSDAYFAGY